MRYWLLTTEYPPFFGGGISTYCFITAKMFVQNGHAVSVFVNDVSVQNHTEEMQAGVRIIRFNQAISGATSFLGHAANVSYAFAHIVKHYIEKEGKPGLIEAQDYLGIAYYLLQYKHLLYDWCAGVPVLVTIHSPAFLYLGYNQVPTFRYPEYWIGEMERFCLQAATVAISPSRYLLEEIKNEFQFAYARVHIIPYPFEAPVNNNNTAQNTNREKIIFYGKLSAQKGTFKLLGYFKKLWDEGFQEPLHAYGSEDIVYHPEGKTMGEIVRRQYATFIKEGKLRLHPKLAPSQMEKHLAGASVIIVPSTVDNLPFVVLEMMAMGNIVLVSKQGGQAEIVTNGIDGFVFDHEAPHTFKDQLFKILMLTEGERKTIQQAAKQKIADTYNLQAVYTQKMAVIETTLLQPAPPLFPFTRLLPAPSPPPNMGFSKSLLSIVVPYYNLGTYVQQTLDALLKTTYLKKEIIIVNDGSTDAGSLKQLDRYRNHPDIKVIDTENSGLATARNNGAQAASGEYLAFLDADDTVAPNYYAKAIEVLKKFDNVHFVGCWTQYFDGSTNVWPTFIPEPPIILYHNTVNSSALVYKRAAFLQQGRNDKNMAFPGLEDYESVIALVAAGYRGVVLPEILFQYRVRAGSMIRSISANKKLVLLQYIAQKHKRFYATFAPEITALLQANGPGLNLDNPTLDYIAYSKNPFFNRWMSKTIQLIKRNPRLKRLALTMYRKLKS